MYLQMTILDGRIVANKLKNEIKEKVSNLEVKPGLAVICIGNDPASQIYVKLKRKVCEELGIYIEEHFFDDNVTQKELIDLIDDLNEDDSIHGILLQSPIPYHLNILELFDRISPKKDIDGFNLVNVGKLSQGQDCFVPCTPLGIMRLLKEYNIEIEGKNCVVVGRSNIVGRPMAQLLINANGTVTVCHSKTRNLGEITKNADILIVAVGKPKFITQDMVKNGAIIVDVGINRVEGSKRIKGDVDFENVKDKCEFITPVPGGVGPMTIVTLMSNLLKAYEDLTRD